MGLSEDFDRGGRAVMDSLLHASRVYSYYERRLESEILKYPLPNHIAIILDGNRRWARYHFLDSERGHQYGADRAEDLLNWIHDIGVKITTLYILSTENLDREDEELHNIYCLLEIKLNKLYNDERVHRRQMRIKAIGDRHKLPRNLQAILTKLEESTAEYNKMFLNIAIAYGGQRELVDAVKKIADMAKNGKIEVDKINEKTIEACLYTSHLPQSSPDLILRTSGEKRLSGFLIWQSAYSELMFMDVFWPEFCKIDLMRAIRTYQRRVRRYGRSASCSSRQFSNSSTFVVWLLYWNSLNMVPCSHTTRLEPQIVHGRFKLRAYWNNVQVWPPQVKRYARVSRHKVRVGHGHSSLVAYVKVGDGYALRLAVFDEALSHGKRRGAA